MGSGAFLVAACRYLAGAYETALVRSGACQEADIGEAERALMRRSIAERCLYGVDLNPMAVQLARLSLWLATLAADRPIKLSRSSPARRRFTDGAWLVQLGVRPARRAGAAGIRARARCSTHQPCVTPCSTHCRSGSLSIGTSGHRRPGPREGTGARRARRTRSRARTVEADRGCMVRRVVLHGGTSGSSRGIRRFVRQNPDRPRHAAGPNGRRVPGSRRRTRPEAPVLSLGARVSRSVFRERRRSAPRRRIRRCDRQSTVGHDSRGSGRLRPPGARANGRPTPAALHARCRAPITRSRTATATATNCFSSDLSR